MTYSFKVVFVPLLIVVETPEDFLENAFIEKFEKEGKKNIYIRENGVFRGWHSNFFSFFFLLLWCVSGVGVGVVSNVWVVSFISDYSAIFLIRV